MKIVILITILLHISLYGSKVDDYELKQMIGQMLVVGFESSHVDENSTIIKDINRYNLGGVILFDRFYKDRSRVKNIDSPAQLTKLTTTLKTLSNHPILISIDQEGGNVARMKPKYGFEEFLSAKKMGNKSTQYAHRSYKSMSNMLKNSGINCNFAPVVDLEINKKNRVIVGLERSFGKSSEKVGKYATILIDEQRKSGVISVLKHFPGHGSSLSDSHLGFVDITNTWSKEELEPYKELIKDNNVDMIMTAHVYNANLDTEFPATLSHNVNTSLLRKYLGYKGVIISDDLQMSAITKHFSLKQSVTLAINSGVNILLFGNQLGFLNTKEVIDIIFNQVRDGVISKQSIVESNRLIKNLSLQFGDNI